jgi:nucleotide-binding universal stress UspA family protein
MNPYTTLLAATDFSADADNAVSRAAMLAGAHGAALELLHVIDESALDALRRVSPASVDLETTLLDATRALLDRRAVGIEQADSIRATPAVRVGSVRDEILAAAERVDLVVLGARGENPIRDAILGTTAESLLRKCRRPVLVVKRPAERRYGRVLVAADFSAHSPVVLREALRIAPAAELDLFHAYQLAFEGRLQYAGVQAPEIERFRAQVRDEAKAKLDALVADIGVIPDRVYPVLGHGDPSSLLLRKASELGVDLIAIGKRGESALEELFLGSVTRHVLADAECDVLMLSAP